MLHPLFKTLNLLALGIGIASLVGCASLPRADLLHQTGHNNSFNVPEPLMLTLDRESVFIHGGHVNRARDRLPDTVPQYLGVYGNAGSLQGPLKAASIASLKHLEQPAEDPAAVIVEFPNGDRHTLHKAYFIACLVEPVGLADVSAGSCSRVEVLRVRIGAPSRYLGWERSYLGGPDENKWLPARGLWRKDRAKATVTVGAAVTEEEAKLTERFDSLRARAADERVKRDTLSRQQKHAEFMALLSKAPIGTKAICVEVGRTRSDIPLKDDFEFRCDVTTTARLGELKQAGWSVVTSDRTPFSDDTVSWRVELKKISAGAVAR